MQNGASCKNYHNRLQAFLLMLLSLTAWRFWSSYTQFASPRGQMRYEMKTMIKCF